MRCSRHHTVTVRLKIKEMGSCTCLYGLADVLGVDMQPATVRPPQRRGCGEEHQGNGNEITRDEEMTSGRLLLLAAALVPLLEWPVSWGWGSPGVGPAVKHLTHWTQATAR